MWLLAIPAVWLAIGAYREKRHVDQINSMPRLPGSSPATFKFGPILFGPFAELNLK